MPKTYILLISRVSIILMPLAYIFSRLLSELSLVGTAIYAVRVNFRNLPSSFKVIGLVWIYTLVNTLLRCPDNWFDAVIWIRYPIFAISVSSLLSEEKTNKRFCCILSATILFLILDGYYQYFTRYDLLGRGIFEEGNGSLERLTGPFKYPRLGSALFVFGVPSWAWLYACYWQKMPLRRKIIVSASAAIAMVILVFLSGERRAMAGILASFGLIVWFTDIPRYWLVSISILTIATLAVVGYCFDPYMLERQAYSFAEALRDFPNSNYGRVWVTALSIAKSNFFFGIGIKQLRYHSTFEDEYAMHAHNYYLEMFSEQGIIGLLLFSVWVVTCLRESYRNCINKKFGIYSTTLAITLLLHFLPITPNPSFYTNWGAIPIWLLIGVIASQTTNLPTYVHIYRNHREDKN